MKEAILRLNALADLTAKDSLTALSELAAILQILLTRNQTGGQVSDEEWALVGQPFRLLCLMAGVQVCLTTMPQEE